ncbi:MAG: hypothetical protein Q9228_005546 [Teloschistes exilis]
MESVLYATLSGIAATAALVMGLYDSLHEVQTCRNGPSSHSDSMTVVVDFIPKVIRNPSPRVFIATLFLFSLATLSTHHICRQHRFQNHFLALAFGICTGVGFLCKSSTPLEIRLREIMPWCILAASIVSAVLHWSIGGPMIRNNEEDEHTVETKDHIREKMVESLELERKGTQETVSRG